MEERVRVCRACNAIVGWFALFCEACGAKQGRPEAAAGAAAPGPAATPPAPSVESEMRVHLTAPAGDARTVARDLFQAQLRLIHRHAEQVEDLIRDVERIKRDVAAAQGLGRREAGPALDGLSERVFDAEQRWGELQVSYNRESEAIEEEGRESMELSDLDAYFSPDENEMIEKEYATLTSRFEALDGLLRDVGRAIALSRRSGESHYLSPDARPAGGRAALLLATVALVGASMYFALFRYQGDPEMVALTVGPVLAALCMWVVFGFLRRR